MLKESYELINILENLIPFKVTITLSVLENELILQALFRKNNTPCYYQQVFSKRFIDNLINEKDIINLYIANLYDFYINANVEDLQTVNLINQTIH